MNAHICEEIHMNREYLRIIRCLHAVALYSPLMFPLAGRVTSLLIQDNHRIQIMQPVGVVTIMQRVLKRQHLPDG